MLSVTPDDLYNWCSQVTVLKEMHPNKLATCMLCHTSAYVWQKRIVHVLLQTCLMPNDCAILLTAAP